MADGILKVGTITTSSGSGTITLGQSGETVDMANGSITLNSSMKNTPAFFANLSGSAQSVSNNVWTKVNLNNEIFDSGDFDATTNYRFTPTVAGKYFLFGTVLCNSGAAGNLHHGYSAIYKNGSFLRYSSLEFDNTNGEAASVLINHIVDFNGSTDYVELYGNVRTGNGSGNEFVANNTWFGAYRILGA